MRENKSIKNSISVIKNKRVGHPLGRPTRYWVIQFLPVWRLVSPMVLPQWKIRTPIRYSHVIV